MRLARSIGVVAGAAAFLIAAFFAAQAALTVQAPPSHWSHASVATASHAQFSAITNSRRILDRMAPAFPAIAVAVAVNGEVVWSESRGLADIGSGRSATRDTQFQIYSASKAITGTLAQRLIEEGKLRLDDHVSEYLPNAPEEVGRAKVRHLLSHTAGIRDYYPFEWFWVSSRHCNTTGEALRPFIDDELDSEPGRAYDYSSYEYVLLSAVLEGASGETFDALLSRVVLDPVHLMNTSRLGGSPSRRALSYGEGFPSGYLAHSWIDNSCKYGAGGLWSTAEDLARFGAAVLAGRIVSPSSAPQLFRSFETTNGKSVEYGMGWGLGRSIEGHRYAGHSGGGLGGRSAIVVFPDDNIAVAITANFEGPRVVDEAAEIGAQFIE